MLLFMESVQRQSAEYFLSQTGGLAIYGGVIGGFATLFIYSHIKKINPFKIGDCAVFGLVIGQIVGRWGNFFNREVFGGYTDSFVCNETACRCSACSDIKQTHLDGMAAMGDVNFIQVHPTFLYEGVWNLVTIAMFVFRKHKKYDGQMCLIYLGRLWNRQMHRRRIRTDQLLIPVHR